MISTAELYKLHTEDFQTISDIARTIGISRQAVHQRFQAAGLKTLIFPYKGRDNLDVTTKSKFEEIMNNSLTLTDAGRKLSLTFHNMKKWMKFHEIKYIPYDRRGRAASSYKIGRTKDKNGYWWVNCHENGYMEFNPNWSSHQVPEHKLLFEMKKLGFPLVIGHKYWHIHHIDEQIENNDLYNLALLTPAEHTSLHALLREVHDIYPGVGVKQYNMAVAQVAAIARELSKANVTKARLGVFMGSDNSFALISRCIKESLKTNTRVLVTEKLNAK